MKLNMTPGGGCPADKLARESMIFVGVCASQCPPMSKYETKNPFQKGCWNNRVVYASFPPPIHTPRLLVE